MTARFRSLLRSRVQIDSQGLCSAREIVQSIQLEFSRAVKQGPSRRPHLILNMASTVDGRASIDGRSGPIGNQADRELFHALRTIVDGVMIGAQTLRTERYNRIVDDEHERLLREQHGQQREPLACVVSTSLALPADIPLLADPTARVVILTPSSATLSAATRAQVQYIHATRDGQLDFSAALTRLRQDFGVRTLLCEGGPHLNSQLLASGLVDELFLSVAPKLAGGEDPAGSLRIVTGVELEPTTELELLSVFENDSNLFLRYRVGGESLS